MPTENRNTRHYDKSIREQEAKLARQRAAVEATEELIEGLKSLRDKAQAGETNAPKPAEPKK